MASAYGDEKRRSYGGGNASSHDQGSLLDRLDSLPRLKSFDAFPKTQPIYTTSRSPTRGLFTLVVAALLFYLTAAELNQYWYGVPHARFGVDSRELGSEMQVNVDVTVAMKCHYLTVDVRDAVGDRLHLSDTDITKDETSFDVGHAGRLDSIPFPEHRPIGDLVDAARHLTRKAHFTSSKSKSKRKAKGYKGKQVAFAPTEHIVKDGDACRIYGSVMLKKMTGNLHISTLGHGYWSWEHTPHGLMNLSHVVHELSFGPYFPDIAQPLDHSVEITHDHFAVFQYFVSIVPTRYIDAAGRAIQTNQYSVTDYARTIQHGMGVPGIFLKFDIEPLTLTLHQRTTSLVHFLVRLAGIIGGVWVCAGYTLRAGDKAAKTALKVYKGADYDGPSVSSSSNDYFPAFASSSSYGPRGGSSSAGYAPRGSAGAGAGVAGVAGAGPGSPWAHQYAPYAPSPGDTSTSTSTSTSHGMSASPSASSVLSAARDKAGAAWAAAADLSSSVSAGVSAGVGGTPKHRKTESLQQKMMSEEGRAW